MNYGDFLAAIALAAGASPDDRTFLVGSSQLEPGWLDKRIILQDEVWRDINLRVLRLEDMSVEYRENVVTFLEEYEDSWAAMALLYVTGDVLLGKVSHAEGVRQHQLVSLLSPGWMRRTPLVRRLLELNDQARR